MPGRSPIYLAAARDRLLAFLRHDPDFDTGCELVGASRRTVERYMSRHPAFSAKVARAKRGEYVESESGETTAPEAWAVVDAVVVDGAPCDATAVPEPKEPAALVRPAAPPGQPRRLGSMSIDDFDEGLVAILRDPDHKHYAKIAAMAFPLFYGAELLAIKRAVERAPTIPGESLSRSRLREILERAKPINS